MPLRLRLVNKRLEASPAPSKTLKKPGRQTSLVSLGFSIIPYRPRMNGFDRVQRMTSHQKGFPQAPMSDKETPREDNAPTPEDAGKTAAEDSAKRPADQCHGRYLDYF